MGEFKRELLPDPVSLFEAEGLTLSGRGVWRTTRCDFHGGSDSMRVKTSNGAWVCMACDAKGGDVVDFVMQRHGSDFLSTVRALGAYVENDKARPSHDRPRAFTARDALEVIVLELNHSMVIISDVRRGVLPTDDEWRRWLVGIGRLETIAQEYRT